MTSYSFTDASATRASFDAKGLLAMVDGDRDLVAQLFDMFLADVPGQLRRMRDAVRTSNFAALKSESHTLKGASGSLRLLAVAEDALGVEMAARNENLIAAAAALSQLERSLEEVPNAFMSLVAAA